MCAVGKNELAAAWSKLLSTIIGIAVWALVNRENVFVPPRTHTTERIMGRSHHV